MNQNEKGVLPILKKHLQNPDRYLRPEAIYSLNRVLYEFLDTLEISEPATEGNGGDGHRAWVVPFLFDQYSRSWHFACVLPHVWDRPNITSEVTKEVLWLLAKMACKPSWKDFSAETKLLAGKDFEGAKNRTLERVNKIKNCSSAKRKMEKYFGLGYEENNCFNKFIEMDGPTKISQLVGLIDQNGPNEKEIQSLVRDTLLVYHGYCGHRGALLPGVLYRNLCEYEEGKTLSLINGEPEKDSSLCGKVKLITSTNEPEEVDYHQTEFKLEDSKAFDVNSHLLDQWIDLSWPFYLRKLLQQQELHRSALPFLILPIYDTWLGNIGYGGLRGCLLCTFQSEGSRKKFVNGVLKELKPVCEILSAELTMSALATIGSIPIEPPYDLIEHFVRVIVHIQDWEMVRVCSNNETLYCYKRSPKDGGYMNAFIWQRCAMQSKDCDHDCKQGELLSWKHCGIETILSNEFIPELSPEEIGSFGDIYIEFKYPASAIVPKCQKGTDTHELFKLAVIERQIEVLRALIPKVRARRAALRSAVSAIMGRNMSHNIGSHVLARYSNEVKNDNQKTDPKFKDPREDFLRYLQRRMDFIAEVATADQSFWSQALSIEVALGTLNLNKEKEAINGKNGGGKRKPILLSYITGKEVKADSLTSTEAGPLTATVEIAGETADHRFFACPSGEVGVHALYVILENIIRNSARHNENPSCPITVRVKIEEEEHPDLWKLTLIDLQTSISAGKCIDVEINEKLNTQILNSDGAPNPKYWGVREMQVCAQYLRNLPLSDLEGPEQIPPIFKAVNNEGCLAYVLYVSRPKLCVMASKKSLLVDDAQKKFLRAKGFDFVLSEGKTDAELADALRGYAYAVIEEGVQGISQASTNTVLPNRSLVGENWVKKIDWPVRTLCLPSNHLEELVSSLPNQAENIQGGDVVSDSAAFNPMKWLEDELHSRLMTEYQNRRGYLAEKKVAVKVGWEDNCNINICQFDHTTTDNLSQWTFERGPFLCWIDHAKAEHFTSELPCLLAACRVITNKPIDDEITISAWVYAEVINSHSAHRHDLVSQRDGKISGNELMAAALAKVVIIDERVQSVACEQYREIGYSTLWPCMGIWVPSTKEANLNFPVFSAICTFLKKPAELSKNLPADFVVLHLTILEKLAQELRCDEQSALSQLINCANLSPSCEVVIVTGRGVPAVARHEASKRLSARYLPISALLEYLVSNPSKLAVMRALWSAATSKTTE